MIEDSAMRPAGGLNKFLEHHGWGGARITPVAGDASFRRYFRASLGNGARAIVMDAPPPHENPAAFVDLAVHLKRQGFRAPDILGADIAQGLVLLEDFGDLQMRMHLDDFPASAPAIYRQAIDLLLILSKKPAAAVPPYDMAAYLRETALLADWYAPAMGLTADMTAFQDLWKGALQAVVACEPKVTVLRDYHSENIMLLDGGGQGIIDFQDALAGHPAYDLVSLLQDARRDVDPVLEQEMLDYYRDRADVDADFDLHYAVLGAQRNSKIIGIFTRLWRRDGKSRYLDFLPRMWGLLERDLAHPGLAEIQYWFDQNIPRQIRRMRPVGAPPQ